MSSSFTILGIDPGSRIAGFGVIQVTGTAIKYREHGVLRLPLDNGFEGRLLELSRQLRAVVSRHQPQIAVIERVFLGKNADSAFKLGHARGVCVLELAAAGAKIVEYAAREVKKGVAGSGAATKEQVAFFVNASLSLRANSEIPADATDALAMAYFHAVQMQVNDRFQRQILKKAKAKDKEFDL